jgi:hypothetical protein
LDDLMAHRLPDLSQFQDAMGAERDALGPHAHIEHAEDDTLGGGDALEHALEWSVAAILLAAGSDGITPESGLVSAHHSSRPSLSAARCDWPAWASRSRSENRYEKE